MTEATTLAAVVLAAGRGTRMQSSLPKALHALAGEPLLAHVLRAARALAPQSLHVVAGAELERLRAALGGDDIHWHAQPEPLGNADALRRALDAVGDATHVLALCADTPLLTPESLRALVACCEDADAAVLTLRIDPADPAAVAAVDAYGRIVRDAGGALQRIVERRDATPEQARIAELNAGVVALRAACAADLLARVGNDNAQGEYYLTDCIGAAVAAGLRVATATLADWREARGVNSMAELHAAERAVQARRADELLAAGVRLADAARVDVRGRVRAGRDVSLDVGVVLEGEVALGDGARVGPYCVLRDVEIGPGAEIRAMTLMESARVGANCVVGPFARIRPGGELCDDARVGNFVEIKHSRIGPGSKVNHLSYVGDATVGARANLGAGVITCNYDGARKHATVIGDDAFIGSGAQLVAPVEIGAGATIGAGSTITRDAKGGALTLSRSPQKTVPGWKRRGD